MLSKQTVVQTPLVPQAMFEDEDADDGEDALGGEDGEDEEADDGEDLLDGEDALGGEDGESDLDCDVQPEPAAPPKPAAPPEPAKKKLCRRPAAPAKRDVDFSEQLRNMGVPLEALPQHTPAGNKCYTVVDDKGKRIQVLHAAKAFYVPGVVDGETRGFHVGWKRWGSVAEAWAQATLLAGFGSHAAGLHRKPAAEHGCKGVHRKPAAEPAAKPATAAPGSKPPAPQRPAAKPATATRGSKPPVPQRPAAPGPMRNCREINPCSTDNAD